MGNYSYSTAHPHAVANITPWEIPSLPEEDITYTSFNKTSSLTQGANSISFLYGSDYSRKRSISTVSGEEITRYYSGNYEKQVTLSGTSENHYILAYGSIVAIYRKTGSTGQMYYVHTDHLGSVNCITGSSGAIVQESSYDAWGNRRDPVSWERLGSPPVSLITNRGFTGHEHLDAFGLINMNGRMYDSEVGRFLSVDPFISDPGYTQSYNRYSYVLNNPLSYTDPSGYLTSDQLWSIMNNLMASEFGGMWTNTGGEGTTHYFSEEEAWNYVGNQLGYDVEPIYSTKISFGKTTAHLFRRRGLEHQKWQWDPTFRNLLPDISISLVGYDLVQKSDSDPFGFWDNDDTYSQDFITFNGREVAWHGSEGDVLHVYNAVSGFSGYQSPKYQNYKNRGPIPEGRYFIDLSPIPTRYAKINNLGNTISGIGIEKIPQGFLHDNPWGNYRDRLMPFEGTNLLGRDNDFYIHDSSKGYTHGCVEVGPLFFRKLLDYQKTNSIIYFYVNY